MSGLLSLSQSPSSSFDENTQVSSMMRSSRRRRGPFLEHPFGARHFENNLEAHTWINSALNYGPGGFIGTISGGMSMPPLYSPSAANMQSGPCYQGRRDYPMGGLSRDVRNEAMPIQVHPLSFGSEFPPQPYSKMVVLAQIQPSGHNARSVIPYQSPPLRVDEHSCGVIRLNAPGFCSTCGCICHLYCSTCSRCPVHGSDSSDVSSSASSGSDSDQTDTNSEPSSPSSQQLIGNISPPSPSPYSSSYCANQ